MKPKTIATATVIRSRFRSTTVDPAIDPPLAPAEHVGQTPAPPGVQQDEQHQQQASEQVDDDDEDVQHGGDDSLGGVA